MMMESLTCRRCDDLFSGYFEGDLDERLRESVDAHVASCARCQSLIRDITRISSQAAALPDLTPSRDLWAGIESRIGPAVVSITDRRHDSGVSRRMLFAAAASLVVVTSSVTYVATTRSIGRKATPQRVAQTAPAPTPAREAPQSPPDESPAVRPDEADQGRVGRGTAGSSVEASVTAVPRAGGARTAASPVARASGAKSSAAALASRTTAPMSSSELALSGEIRQLQRVLQQKRSDLDPATIQVVEDNLNLIDAAVKQARAALARDPASGFLTEKLDDALQKKVELLRTVALLPSKS
ncbi:MAG TPA: zf-HC2 domain-containing protein [Gemmatimonadaceae bacterium]|nr:zf-HC2 domain-containing protein [Gemmatimonadaceae bacterium]